MNQRNILRMPARQSSLRLSGRRVNSGGPMSPPDLLSRIRAEYREMPGLRLTFAEACRLWQLAPADCDMVLRALVQEQFLACTQEGAFVAASRWSGMRTSTRPRM
jgi:hypothetical protein